MDRDRSRAATGITFGILWALSVAHLFNDTLQSVIAAIYPMLKHDLTLSFAQIGLITLIYQLAGSVFQPLAGLYFDKRPSAWALPAGMAVTMFGLLGLAYASSFAGVLAMTALTGIGSSVFHPEASRVAQMASGGRKSLAQSIFQVGGNGGSAVGPLLAALVILPYGQHAVGWFAAAALAASLILVRVGAWYSLMLDRTRHLRQTLRKTGCGLSARQTRRALAILVTMLFSKYFFTACMTSYFTFFLIEKFGISVRQSQFCLFAFLAAFATGTLLGGFLGDRYGRKYVILFSILGAAPFSLALPYLGLGWTVATAVASGLIIASAFSAILVYATELKPDKVGMISGVFFGLMFGLGGIGSAFFGWLADRTSIGFVFRISSLLPLLGIIAVRLPDLQSGKKKKK